jgi:hypothetical protein
MRLSKYATDDQGQEDHRGGNEQAGRNLLPESNEVSSSRPARLTARIEFRGPQFYYGVSMVEAHRLQHLRLLSVAVRPVPHCERPFEL